MDFTKLKLNESVATGDHTSLKTIQKSTGMGMRGTNNMRNNNNLSKTSQLKQNTSLGNAGGVNANQRRSNTVSREMSSPQVNEYFQQKRQEKEYINAYESQKSDWRKDLQEKLVDGREEDNHPFVSVMPTGDENLVQAIKQMRGEVKDKRKEVTGKLVGEEVEDIEEAKKKCKDGYEYDKDKKKCVKKKSKTSYILRPRRGIIIGGGHHHHHHDHDNDSDKGSNGSNGGNGNEGTASGGDAGGGGGGGE